MSKIYIGQTKKSCKYFQLLQSSNCRYFETVSDADVKMLISDCKLLKLLKYLYVILSKHAKKINIATEWFFTRIQHLQDLCKLYLLYIYKYSNFNIPMGIPITSSFLGYLPVGRLVFELLNTPAFK